MIGKNYTKIHEEGNSIYYRIDIDDVQYLAIASYETIMKEKRRLFYFKMVEERVLTSVKLLPINSAILFLMLRTIILDKKDNINEDGEVIDLPTYDVIDDYEHLDVKKDFEKVIDSADVNYPFRLSVIPKNAIAKGYAKENFHYFVEETFNKLNRTYYMYKTSKYGYLHVVKIDSVGVNTETSTSLTVNNYLLSRELIYKVLGTLELDLDNILGGNENGN